MHDSWWIWIFSQLDMLEKVGADILMPVHVGDTVGTAVDYAHISFNQVTKFTTQEYYLGMYKDLVKDFEHEF